MKKGFIVVISLICAVVICSSMLISAKSDEKTVDIISDKSTSLSQTELNLLSMLNHNFVYGSAFDNADDVVNLSMNALLSYKNDDYIKENLVTDFVNNMYGIDVVDLSEFNSQYPHKDGYVFVVAGGFTRYNHKNISIKNNEDGTISVRTDVTVFYHDGNKDVYKANSLFVPNENSSFGYNIVYSEIETPGVSL